jgi:two-component system, NtrC family, sensor kinase
MWGHEFQNVARILGSLLLLLIGITCTYFTANAFAKKKTGELILAGEALQESEEKLLQTIQGISIATFVIDKEHFITHWNSACENLTGVSANQIVGTKKQWSVLYSKERPVLADFIVDKLSEEEIAGHYDGKTRKSTFTEGAYNAEAFFPDLGKNGKWLFFTAAPLRDYQGEVIGAIETLQDITNRKQAEEELAKHRDHLVELVKKRTKELEEKNKELERFNDLFTGREFRIKELKDKVKKLEKK